MNLLGIHNGNHDAAACLFRDYELVAAVSLERLTRHKNAGVTADAEMPTAAIDECLAIGGISRRDVDVICSTHSHWNLQTYRLKGRWRVKQLWYRLIGTQRLMPLDKMLRTQQTRNIAAVLAPPRILKRYGFDKASINFSYHHMAHAIPAYFFSEFDDALLYTADGMGDGISFSARNAGPSEIEHLFGTDELWDRYTVNSVGMLYGEFTGALGFRKNRHEGKVTGLAAYGQPKAAGDILHHFKVAPNGEITSDFSSFRAMGEFAAEVCRAKTLRRQSRTPSSLSFVRRSKGLCDRPGGRRLCSAAASSPMCGLIGRCWRGPARSECSCFPPWAMKACRSAAASSISLSAMV